jgi:hypothetical protein
MKHFCSICKNLRSEKYHRTHRLLPWQTPKPGVCSRLTCQAAKKAILENYQAPIVIKIHHYHYSTSGKAENKSHIELEKVNGRVELPGSVPLK